MTGKQNGPANHDMSSRTHVWIVFPVLDWLFFRPEHREIIYDLKSKGDFRGEGIGFRIIMIFVLVLLFLSVSVAIFLLPEEGLTKQDLYIKYGFSSLFFIFSLAPLFVSRHGGWLQQVTGVLVDGVIVRAHHYQLTVAPHWAVSYQYTDENNKTYDGKLTLDTNHFEGNIPSAGDVVYVFYDKIDHSKSSLFVPYGFRKTCISWSLYDAMKDKPFLRSHD